MISRINPELIGQLQTQIDIDPIKAAALFVEKTARLEGVSLDDVVKSIEHHNHKGSAQSLRQLIGMTDG
jgi:predicted amino acid racemase